MHQDAQRGFDAIIQLGREAYDRELGVIEQAGHHTEEVENMLVDARVDGEETNRDENGKISSYKL